MNNLSKIIFVATIGLALAFIFSCSSDNNDSNGGSSLPSVGSSTSSSSGISSSSRISSSSGGSSSSNRSSSSSSSTSYSSGVSSSTVDSSSSRSSSSSVVSSSSVASSSSSRPSSSSVVSSSSVASSSSSRPSSSSVVSSSSVASSSSIQTGIINGTPVTYNGETYQTVVMGTQTWFKSNLNYNVSGSKCYDNSEANCTKYGRLYNWATAMGLDATCNSSTCASQVQTKHKGICPQGWHIPNAADWNTLMKFVNPSCSNNSNSNCAGAGTKLKATSGWNNISGNGEDTYGFSALPGGFGNSDGSFDDVGYKGNWWSASEIYLTLARYRHIYYDDALEVGDLKSNLYSVRCLQD